MPVSKILSDSLTAGVGGKTLQMIRAAAAARVAGSVTAYTLIDTGVTASITPSSSSSRILILSQINMNAATATYHFSLIKRSIGGLQIL